MERDKIKDIIGRKYLTRNLPERDEWSYVQAAGSKKKLEELVGEPVNHTEVDIRFEDPDTNLVILVETKWMFTKVDEAQLAAYVKNERALNPNKKIIAILANTYNDDKIKVFRSIVDEAHTLWDETVLDTMEHYNKVFEATKSNNKEKVMQNTYALNEFLHKLDIKEGLRSQFVGTVLLYVKDRVEDYCIKKDVKVKSTKEYEAMISYLNEHWDTLDGDTVINEIKGTLGRLLDGSKNKKKKVELLQKTVLEDQVVTKLTIHNWKEIFKKIILDIYRYIDTDTSEGQDILNLFFITFNKYTGKADKNQAFTPDHITDFMCKITEINRTKVVLDATCGSGSFLVQAMVKELADCKKNTTEQQQKALEKVVKEKHIYGIEIEEKAFGLATTNMLIHGDGNSNIICASMFDSKQFIKDASPDVILMNPPYNAKPKGIPNAYKTDWTAKQKDGMSDPTKGFVFLKFIADFIKEMNDERIARGESKKEVKCAILLPVSVAIGTDDIIKRMKEYLLKENTLDAVFTLPNEIFYPGASASTCCMLFTLGRPHINASGIAKKTFFGYCKDDGFKKKKNLGRMEQFDKDGISKWEKIEKEWINLYMNSEVKDGLSAKAVVGHNDEWLCEAYMKTDYSTLTEQDFQQTLNNYLAFLVKAGKLYET